MGEGNFIPIDHVPIIKRANSSDGKFNFHATKIEPIISEDGTKSLTIEPEIELPLDNNQLKEDYLNIVESLKNQKFKFYIDFPVKNGIDTQKIIDFCKSIDNQSSVKFETDDFSDNPEETICIIEISIKPAIFSKSIIENLISFSNFDEEKKEKIKRTAALLEIEVKKNQETELIEEIVEEIKKKLKTVKPEEIDLVITSHELVHYSKYIESDPDKALEEIIKNKNSTFKESDKSSIKKTTENLKKIDINEKKTYINKNEPPQNYKYSIHNPTENINQILKNQSNEVNILSEDLVKEIKDTYLILENISEIIAIFSELNGGAVIENNREINDSMILNLFFRILSLMKSKKNVTFNLSRGNFINSSSTDLSSYVNSINSNKKELNYDLDEHNIATLAIIFDLKLSDENDRLLEENQNLQYEHIIEKIKQYLKNPEEILKTLTTERFDQLDKKYEQVKKHYIDLLNKFKKIVSNNKI